MYMYMHIRTCSFIPILAFESAQGYRPPPGQHDAESPDLQGALLSEGTAVPLQSQSVSRLLVTLPLSTKTFFCRLHINCI